MNTAYLLLGSNEGDRDQILELALASLQEKAGTLLEQSHIYETAAWGLEDQPAFLNIAVKLHTSLEARDLLDAIHEIEKASDRQRKIKWGQRTLDIDILFFNSDIINTPDLKVPHPLLQQRMFALAPMEEIAPGLVHPVLNKKISELKAECMDKLPVARL